MKTTQLYILIAFTFFSCGDSKPADGLIVEYENIFGDWVVTQAKFIRGENPPAHIDKKGKELEESYLRYHYRFFDDSTFERGKPAVKHGNVEEAHGKSLVVTCF